MPVGTGDAGSAIRTGAHAVSPRWLRTQPGPASATEVPSCKRQLVTTAQRQQRFRTPSACVSGDFYPRISRSSRNVDQPDHILANPLMSHEAERRPWSGEVWFAVTEHHRVQVDSILIDQAKFGEALRQARASHF